MKLAGLARGVIPPHAGFDLGRNPQETTVGQTPLPSATVRLQVRQVATTASRPISQDKFAIGCPVANTCANYALPAPTHGR